MNTYPKYKDSGEQWLGQIPEHWEMMQWHFLMQENTTLNTDCQETQQLQFKYGEIIPKANQEVDEDVKKIICKYTKVEPNDIMINGLNLNYDFISQRIGMVRTNGIITSAYISLRPTTIANPSFYNYLLKAMDAQKMFHGMGTGVRLTLSYKELKNKYLPFPPKEEQEAMVAYLDEQTAQIDNAIAREQKMIDLLEERKQIIIQQAVTKGLNPNVSMKDSGIDWIGEIPEHWEVNRLKLLFTLHRGYDLTNEEFVDGGVPVYGSSGFMGYHNKIKATAPNVVIGRSGSVGKLHYVEEDFWAHNTGIYISDTKRNVVKFLYYLLSAIDIAALSTQTAVPTLDRKKVQDTIFSFTTNVEEQQAIVAYLDTKLASIDKAIAAKNRVITLLQERKQIIINEVVTGKIKVL